MTNTQAILFQTKYKIDVLTDGTFKISFKSSPASLSESFIIKSERELDKLIENGIVQFSILEWNKFVKDKINFLKQLYEYSKLQKRKNNVCNTTRC